MSFVLIVMRVLRMVVSLYGGRSSGGVLEGHVLPPPGVVVRRSGRAHVLLMMLSLLPILLLVLSLVLVLVLVLLLVLMVMVTEARLHGCDCGGGGLEGHVRSLWAVVAGRGGVAGQGGVAGRGGNRRKIRVRRCCVQLAPRARRPECTLLFVPVQMLVLVVLWRWWRRQRGRGDTRRPCKPVRGGDIIAAAAAAVSSFVPWSSMVYSRVHSSCSISFSSFSNYLLVVYPFPAALATVISVAVVHASGVVPSVAIAATAAATVTIVATAAVIVERLDLSRKPRRRGPGREMVRMRVARGARGVHWRGWVRCQCWCGRRESLCRRRGCGRRRAETLQRGELPLRRWR